MEYTVKIFSKCQLKGSQIWKYDFLNIDSNQWDFFYHNEQISYNPNVVGKLTLNENKFFQSFKQELINLAKEDKKEEILINSEKEIDNTVEKIIRRSKNVSVDLQHLKHLREMGFSHEEIGTVYKRCERTIYRWFKPIEEPLQKRGVKPKISEEVINLVRSYTLENKTRTQTEIAEHVCHKSGVVLSQPSICISFKATWYH